MALVTKDGWSDWGTLREAESGYDTCRTFLYQPPGAPLLGFVRYTAYVPYQQTVVKSFAREHVSGTAWQVRAGLSSDASLGVDDGSTWFIGTSTDIRDPVGNVVVQELPPSSYLRAYWQGKLLVRQNLPIAMQGGFPTAYAITFYELNKL